MKKNLIYSVVLFLIISCKPQLKNTELPIKLTVNKKHQLQFVFYDYPPDDLAYFDFMQADSIVKELDGMTNLKPGDTVVIDWPLRPKTTYSLVGFNKTGGIEFYHLKHEAFWIDINADTIITNYRPDRIHEKITY